MRSPNTHPLSPGGHYAWDGQKWLPRRKRHLFRNILIVVGALFALIIALSTYDVVRGRDRGKTPSEHAAVAKVSVAVAPIVAPLSTSQPDQEVGKANAYYSAVRPELSVVGTLTVNASHVCATGSVWDCRAATWDANVATLTLEKTLRTQNPPRCLKQMDADLKASTSALSQGLRETWRGVNAADRDLVAAGGHHIADARVLMGKAYAELKAVPCGLPA
jgi:hypothetical protein